MCNEILVAQTVVAALGHSYAAEVTDPTCTAQGYTTYTCSACGDSYVSDYTAASGHNYVAGESTAATCTEQGVTEYTCSACGTSKTTYTAANGHTYVNGTCSVCGEVEPVSTNAAKIGSTEYETLAAAIAAASAGDTITLLKSVSENVTVSTDVTIDLGGYTVTGVDGTVFEIAANVTIQNGTITGGTGRLRTSGSNTYYDGGAIYLTAYYSLTLTNVTITGNSATYGGAIYSGAYATLTVTDCVITGNTATSYGGGIYVGGYTTLTVNALVYGNTAGSAGADIGLGTGVTYSLSTDFGSAVDSEGHTITGWYKETAKNRYSEDNITDEVAASGTTSSTVYVIAAHGENPVTHEHSYTAVVTAPTCTAQGYTTYTCSGCEDSYVSDYTEATGHSYTSVVTAPTCTEQGSTVYTCTNCGTSYTEYTAALGHTAVVDEAVAATCTETGLTAGSHCSVCGEILTAQETVAALGHTEVTDAAVAATCT